MFPATIYIYAMNLTHYFIVLWRNDRQGDVVLKLRSKMYVVEPMKLLL